MEVLNSIHRDDWDRLVLSEPSFSLLQSWQWGAFKQDLGWTPVRVAVEDAGTLLAGAQMLVKHLPLGISVAYVPRGPVGAWREPAVGNLLLGELCRVARSHGAVFLKLEPPALMDAGTAGLLAGNGFRRTDVVNQPRATIILDLSRGPEAILRGMRKKTRQYVRRAEREGITVRIGNASDLPAYCELMRGTGQREHFASRGSHYYRAEWEAFACTDEAVLLLAYHEDRLVAARAVYRFGTHAAEFHAGSVDIPGLHANYLLVWEAIQWALERGCATYDLWGIPDEIAETDEGDEPPVGARRDGLWGVYQFKRGFGTDVVSYIGAYDRVFIPGIYRLFNLALSWGKWWEHVAALLDAPGFDLSPKQQSEIAGGDE